MTQYISVEVRTHTEAVPGNLVRLTDGLARGLHMPVKVEGSDVVGFVVRLDDGPCGPIAVVHYPESSRVRFIYRDPDELVLLAPDRVLHG
jgi:hypothetical protein